MPAHTGTLLAHLQHLAAPAASDAALLARWLSQREEAAFAALVARHGPMVLGVCRRIVGDAQQAEDVFQATFLVLARKAARLRRPEALASFLYGIALRLARRARLVAARRPLTALTPQIPEPVDPSPHPLDVLSGRELLALLDTEVARLPEVYRLPLLLCVLQGRTLEEAARQLGWSIGSLRGRLERGRARLQQRLGRRGLGLSVGVVALLAPVAVPEHLLAASVRPLASPVPAAVRALAGGSLSGKWVGLGLLVLATAGLAAGLPLLHAPKPEPAAAAVPAAQAKNEPLRDPYGDPLPPGAVARLGTVRFRVEAQRVEALGYAPNGKTFAVVTHQGLTLFEAAGGKRTKTIRSLPLTIWRAAISPDGKQILAAAQEMKVEPGKTVVQIWDVASGNKLNEVELEHIRTLGWTAEGQPLVACQKPGEIILVEIATGRKRSFKAPGLSDPERDVASSCAVGKTLLAAGEKTGVIHLWDRASGKERWTFKAGDGFPFHDSLVLSADERLFVSLARKGADKLAVQLWDLTTGKATHTLAAEQPGVEAAIFTPDGKMLATVSHEDVRLWDTASGREQRRLQGAEEQSFNPAAVAFAPDGRTLATTESLGNTIHLWDVATGKPKPQPEGHSTTWLGTPTFSPDGTRVITSGGLDGAFRVWETATGRQRLLLRHPWPHSAITCSFAADGRTLLACWVDQLLLADAATGRTLHVLEAREADSRESPPLWNAFLSLDGRKALVLENLADPDAMLGGQEFRGEWRLTGWDTSTRKQQFRRRLAYQGSSRSLVVSSDAGVLAVPQEKHDPMYLENAATGERLRTFPLLKGQPSPLAFSPDGRLLLSHASLPAPSLPGGLDRTLHLWEALTARELLAMPVSIYLFATAAFSPDGRLLATVAPEGDIVLLDLPSGKERQRLKGHGSSVTSLAFSPDGRRLVSGLYNSTALVWEVKLPENSGKHAAADLAKAWTDLGSSDAPLAFRTRWQLVSAPAEAVSFLKSQLHLAQAADPERLHRLLTDLESEQFAVREKAQEELTELGDLAEPALRKTLEGKPALEVRRRVQALLERLHAPVTKPELLRSLRAVAVLEDIGTAPARGLLEELARGAPEARLTREAKAALRRLALR
jgi:RNA polymerase sigma factor (sigma-70 family)